MKKLLMATAVMFLVGAVLRADTRLTPRGEANALATADYGGYDSFYATAGFLVSGAGVNYGTATLNATSTGPASGVWLGVIWSSGTTADFLDVFDSTSADIAARTSIGTRLYNVGSSTGGTGAYAAGFSGPPKPKRFNKGLIIRPSRADLNVIELLYYQYP
mgnify:CR=1 FL=1